MKQAAFLRRALALLGHDVRRETRQAQALAGSLLYLVAGVLLRNFFCVRWAPLPG